MLAKHGYFCEVYYFPSTAAKKLGALKKSIFIILQVQISEI